jgi:hypothetical protein
LPSHRHILDKAGADVKKVILEPARGLLATLTKDELVRLGRRRRLRVEAKQSKDAVLAELARHLAVDDVTETLLALFPKRGGRGLVRLDQAQRLTGAVTVHSYGRASAGQGRVLLEHGELCLRLRLPNIQLFLENRWPVAASDAGEVPASMLYAGYVRRGRVHPSAGALPPADRPFVLDDGEYGLRQGRLRFELRRSGLLSFRVYLMRFAPKSRRAEYIFQPIM